MTLELPLKTRRTVSGIRIYDQLGGVVADVWAEEWDTEKVLEHRAEVIKAALEADAEKEEGT